MTDDLDGRPRVERRPSRERIASMAAKRFEKLISGALEPAKPLEPIELRILLDARHGAVTSLERPTTKA